MPLGSLTWIIGKSKKKVKSPYFTSVAQKSQHLTNGKEEAEGALMSYPRLLLQCFILGHLWSELLFYTLQGRKEVEKRICRSPSNGLLGFEVSLNLLQVDLLASGASLNWPSDEGLF